MDKKTNLPPLHDNDLMIFGKYKGTRLGDVPDDYLIWFLSQDWCDMFPDLVEYANNCVDY